MCYGSYTNYKGYESSTSYRFLAAPALITGAAKVQLLQSGAAQVQELQELYYSYWCYRSRMVQMLQLGAAQLQELLELHQFYRLQLLHVLQLHL